MCNPGDTDQVTLCVPADQSYFGEMHLKFCSVDRCLSHILVRLNNLGYLTASSCCGHGKGTGSIWLHDGSKLSIEEAQALASAHQPWRDLKITPPSDTWVEVLYYDDVEPSDYYEGDDAPVADRTLRIGLARCSNPDEGEWEFEGVVATIPILERWRPLRSVAANRSPSAYMKYVSKYDPSPLAWLTEYYKEKR